MSVENLTGYFKRAIIMQVMTVLASKPEYFILPHQGITKPVMRDAGTVLGP